VLVPIADGSEEIEAVCIIDTLVRAGAHVTVASVMDQHQVTCSRGVKIVADALIGDVGARTFDAIVIPGGMPGAEHLAKSEPLAALLKAQASAGRLNAAICAAPVVVLQKHGLLVGRKATAHPAFSDKLLDQAPVSERVVVRHCANERRAGACKTPPRLDAPHRERRTRRARRRLMATWSQAAARAPPLSSRSQLSSSSTTRHRLRLSRMRWSSRERAGRAAGIGIRLPSTSQIPQVFFRYIAAPATSCAARRAPGQTADRLAGTVHEHDGFTQQ